MNTTSNPRGYPRTVNLGDAPVEISLLQAADVDALGSFVKTLPGHDLLFVRRDVSHPKVLEAWAGALADGSITSLAARSGGALVRVLTSPEWRGRGLGRALIQESFALALGLGLEKLVVQMTVDQRAAIAVFEGLGFRAEAVLQGHVKDRYGKTHDLVLLSHHVAAVQSRQQAYGLTDALGG